MLEVKLLDSDDDVIQLIDMVVESGYKYCKLYYDWLNSKVYASTTIFIATIEGKAVGCYAIHEQEFACGDHRLNGAFGTQAVVHPNHRNLETIITILKFVEKWSRENGLDFIYAIPNHKMAPVKKKLMNWLLNTQVTERVVKRSEILSRLDEIIPEERIKVERVSTSSEARDLLVGLNRYKPKGINLCTGPTWFVNRYIENPKEHYLIYYVDSPDLKELYVFKIFSNSNVNKLHIVDYFSSSGKRLSINLICCSLCSVLSRFSFDEVTFWDFCGIQDDLNSEILCKPLSHHSATILSQNKITPFMGMSDAY